MMHVDNHVFDADRLQPAQHNLQQGNALDLDKRFGFFFGVLPQPAPNACGEDHCFHRSPGPSIKSLFLTKKKENSATDSHDAAKPQVSNTERTNIK
jgi:hypothetical protein